MPIAITLVLNSAFAIIAGTSGVVTDIPQQDLLLPSRLAIVNDQASFPTEVVQADYSPYVLGLSTGPTGYPTGFK